jgi:hypothetical protein
MRGEDCVVTRLIVRCAWCERVRAEGGWSPEPLTAADILRLRKRAFVTHGICPDCFDGISPDVPYPEE